MGSRALLHRSLLVVGVLLPWGPAQTAWTELEETHYRRAASYVEQRMYVEAESLARETLAITEARHGADSLEVANGLDVLVDAIRGMGSLRHAEAAKLAERAIRIKERLKGPDYPGLVVSLINLSAVYRDGGDDASAQPLVERALSLAEKSKHPSIVPALRGLGATLQERGDYERARPLFERAIAIQEKSLGADHPEVASSLTALAILLRRAGDSAGARRLHARALRMRETVLGASHPDVAESLNNLANILYESKRYQEARPLYERALAIQEAALGADSPETAAAYHNFASLLYQIGDRAAAKTYYQRALAIWEKSLRPDHPHLVAVRAYLAELQSEPGDRPSRPSIPEPVAAEVARREGWQEHYAQGERALKAQDWGRAVERITRALEANPDPESQVRTPHGATFNYYPYYKLGIAYFNLGRYGDALKALDRETTARAVEGSPTDLQNLVTFRKLAEEALEREVGERKRIDAIVARSLDEARAHERSGRLDAALAAIGKGLAVAPSHREATQLMSRLREAIGEAERKRIGGEQAQKDEVARLLGESEGLLRSGEYARLLSLLNRVLALDPANASAIGYLKQTLASLNRSILRDEGGAIMGPKMPPIIALTNPGAGEISEEAVEAVEVVDRPSVVIAGIVVDDQPEVELAYGLRGDSEDPRILARETLTGKRIGSLYSFHFSRALSVESGIAHFRVVASDTDGLKGEAMHRVRYDRPWTRSPWVVPGLGAALLSVAGAGFGYRARRRNRLLSRRFNPYVAGAPVLDDRLFMGREELLSLVLQTIPNNSILLYGERRIGKTSLQHQIKKRLTQLRDPVYEFYPVYIDLQGTGEDRFFATLAEEIFGQLSGALSGARAESEPYGYPALVRDLQKALRILRGKTSKKVKLVLLIDEVDELNGYDPKVNQKLRSLFMKSFAEDLVAVVSGVAIKKQWTSEGSPWYNFFEEIPVKPFSRDEARRLVLQPIRGVFQVDDGVVDRILEVTDCKPYRIQKACIALVHRLHEDKRRRMTVADVEAVSRAAEA